MWFAIKSAVQAACDWLLSTAVGRVMTRAVRWLGRMASPVISVVKRGARAGARAVAKVATAGIKLYSMLESPFTWAIGNTFNAGLRGLENVFNWVFKKKNTYMHNKFPKFNLAQSQVRNLVDLYPFAVFTNWVLSPLTGKSWYLGQMADYREQTLRVTDEAHFMKYSEALSRFAYHLPFWAMYVAPEAKAEPTKVEEPVKPEEIQVNGELSPLTEEETAEIYRHRGLTQIRPMPGADPNNGNAYMWVTPWLAEDGIKFTDFFGRRWAMLKEGSPTSFEEVFANSGSTPPATSSTPPEEEIKVDELEGDWAKITSIPARSEAFGRAWAKTSARKFPDFTTSTQRENMAKSLMMQHIKGLHRKSVLKGWDEEFESIKASIEQPASV